MTNRIATPLIAAAAAVGLLFVSGCGSSGPDANQQEKSVQNAQSLRSYYDKAGGDYESLDEADRAAYIKLSGGEEIALRNWDLMKNGPGAVDRSAQTPAGSGGQ